ncbi:MAG: aminotransferase class V-fold PLP-dependent enzyme [Tunicatimonas sp.]
MKDIFFTPGPSELYFTVEDHLKRALKEQIPSISHRSARFEAIYQEAATNLRSLLSLPDNFHVLFTGSATEIWERLIENCVAEQSHHYVNGAFSRRFYQVAQQLRKQPTLQEAPEGTCVAPDAEAIPSSAELVAFTQNETSTGAAQPLDDIYAIRRARPDLLVAVDAVSTLPYPDIDYTQVDSVFFSVQKGFGLPAGLGVWLVNDRCVEKAQQLEQLGHVIGTYHSLPSLMEKARKHQTPETPNVLAIYLLAKVTGDMLTKGITQIRRETEYKASLLYQTLAEHPLLSAFVNEPKYRSKTVIVAETRQSATDTITALKKNHLIIGSGYGSFKQQHLRIANFPTHSKEQIEALVDKLNAKK